jgi:hypothetical protein
MVSAFAARQRLVLGQVKVADDVTWLQERHQWPGLQGVVMVESERQIPGPSPQTDKFERETRFYITSLLWIAAQLGPAVRAHWMVENGLHWVMDKKKAVQCNGGRYDPTPSSRRAELAPRYNIQGINRHDGPEDGRLSDRCLTGGLPEFGAFAGGSFRRFVQTPSGISMFYDVGQGQGWQRNIVMNGSPHLPANIRQWYGDSRGHWEGNTLVIDVTNFSPKTDYQGSRENLHLVERWTRTGPSTLEYVVTIEDPTVWTRPWTVKQEFTKQSEQENRIYYEPRCLEGNYAFPSLMHAARIEDLDFAQGRGPVASAPITPQPTSPPSNTWHST